MKGAGRYWLNLLRFALVLLGILGLAGWLGLLYWNTLAFIQPPRVTASGDFLRQNRIEYREVALVTADGLQLHAWYTPPQNGAVILLAHGHMAAIPEDIYVLFASRGYGVLAWDFRAHGESEGEYTTIGNLEVLDVKAALEYALAQPGVEHVGGWGASMGAATMIRAAAQFPQIEAVVADSAFTTLQEVLDMRVAPGYRFLVRRIAEFLTGVQVADVDPEQDVARLTPRPVLIIQGLADRNIPPDSARRLFAAAGEPKQIWVEAGVPHVSMYLYHPGPYTGKVIQFFDEYLLK